MQDNDTNEFGWTSENDFSPAGAKSGFYFSIVVLSAISGSIVGAVWALALGKKILAGIVLGIVIDEIYWLSRGKKLIAGMHDSTTKDTFESPKLLLIASSLLSRSILGNNTIIGLVGLVVWLIRFVAKS